MNADYHHLAKVLDLIAGLSPTRVLETGTGEGLYAPLLRRYFPAISTVEVTDAESAHKERRRFDLVLFPIDTDDHHATLDHVRTLLDKHRGVIAIAPKSTWDKSDFAGVGPSLFVNDATQVIAYLGTTSDIKKLRRELLRGRVRRQITGASRDRRTR